jgi:tetratricopeptide (TPR) repeat protein
MESNSQKDIPGIAESMIKEGKRTDPENILKDFVSKIPPDWEPVKVSETAINIAYWNMEEFINHAPHYDPDDSRKMVVWVTPSYSKAFYLLAFIYVERKDWFKAMSFIDQAISLEPDLPLLLREKAMILSRLGRHQEAHDLFSSAAEIRPWAPLNQKARALRGAAIALIDLKRTDEAEELLKKSLEIEPDSTVALNELDYIHGLRKGLKPTDSYDLV